ncbi:MAG: tetratricopeptide repeat protein [Planctomycetes bacterium]|nr:tetratricopeptide repeat protein [Planctomycetota bacterium]
MSSESQTPMDAESIFADYLARLEGGESVTFEGLLLAHPALADELKQLESDRQSFGSFLVKAAPGKLIEDDPSAGAQDSVGGGTANTISSDELLRRLAESSAGSGRYRFRALVGRGGMGAILKVWDRELRRPLAMKVVLGKGEEALTGATPRVEERALARFLDEAQITSQLDHPGIVPVHELGTDESGRAYFTMRLVRGEDFEKVIEHVHAGRDGWTLTRALNVLVKVCEALAYAHSRGVVHRDIKPANVMVGKYGEAYLMDWGCARNLDQPERRDIRITTAPKQTGEVKTLRRDLKKELPNSPLFTMDGDVIGTPAYMSPEQARGDLEQVGVQSDVYSMGALLYHLLSGREPYIPEGVRPSAYMVLRWVLEGPPKSLDSLAPTASPELVSIAEKAMAREPRDRYPGAESFARELQAYLDGRVVASHETGTWPETKKWVKRNKALSSALLAALLIAIGGAIAFSMTAEQARAAATLAQAEATRAEKNAEESRRNADAAELARREADENARLATKNEETAKLREKEAKSSEARAKKVTEFVQNALISSDPNQGGSHGYLVVEAMHSALGAIEAGDLEGEPEVAASLYRTIAKILHGNGEADMALEAARRGLAELKRVHSADHESIAVALHDIAACLLAAGQVDAALESAEAAREMCQRIWSGDSEELADILDGIGLCLNAQGLYAESLKQHDAALAMRRRMHPEPGSEVADTLTCIGGAYMELNRFDDAEVAYAEALSIYERTVGPESPDCARVMRLIGSCRMDQGSPDAAFALAATALDIDRTAFEGDHPAIEFGLNHVAAAAGAIGMPEVELALYQEELAMSRRLYAEDHPSLIGALNDVGTTLNELDAGENALPFLREATEMWWRLACTGSSDGISCFSNLGVCLESLGRVDEATLAFKAGVAACESVFETPQVVTARTLDQLGRCMTKNGHAREGVEHHKRALAMFDELYAHSSAHPDHAIAYVNAAVCLAVLERTAEAKEYAERSHAIARACMSSEDPRLKQIAAIEARLRTRN